MSYIQELEVDLKNCQRARDAAYQILCACHEALSPCAWEELDYVEGARLVEQIEALFPDLKPPPGRPVL